MTQSRGGFAVLLLLGAALAPATCGADDGLSLCARLENADERLACYGEVPRETESPSAGAGDTSPRPSHLTEASEPDDENRGGRHLADILEYRPNYIIARWTNNPNTPTK